MAHATRWSPNLGKWRKSVQLHMIPFNLGVETPSILLILSITHAILYNIHMH